MVVATSLRYNNWHLIKDIKNLVCDGSRKLGHDIPLGFRSRSLPLVTLWLQTDRHRGASRDPQTTSPTCRHATVATAGWIRKGPAINADSRSGRSVATTSRAHSSKLCQALQRPSPTPGTFPAHPGAAKTPFPGTKGTFAIRAYPRATRPSTRPARRTDPRVRARCLRGGSSIRTLRVQGNRPSTDR
jgi:hypothetical protein